MPERRPLDARVLASAAVIVLGLAAAPAAVHASTPERNEAASLAGPERTVAGEVECLALNLYYEARSEPLEGLLAVAAVTLNRVRSPRYPNTVCEVVWQPGQFSWTSDGRSDRPREHEAWERALLLAAAAYDGPELESSALVGNAIHYHRADIDTRWARQGRKVRQIGRHVFYEAADR